MPTHHVLASGLSWIDLLFLGRPDRIGCGIVSAPGSLALVDPGPSTCLGTLEGALAEQGLALADVTHLLLTHIHLDHAGVAGVIVRRHPGVTVVVHDRGARHLSDPTRLIDSARRLYGDAMDRLWGEVVPVPAPNLLVCHGGESIEAGGRVFEVAYTPGHASHHVSYFDRSSGVAFVGDTGGVCVDGGYVLPPTPPPDIDLESWRQSIETIAAWNPATLFLTHCGPVHAVPTHLQALLENLEAAAALVRASLGEPGTDDDRKAGFEEWIRGELRRRMSEERAAAYESAAAFDLLWLGLARYWRKHDAGAAAR